MQPNQLVELAALTAAQGRALVGDDRPISETGLAQYWQAARQRLDRWSVTLAAAEKNEQSLQDPITVATVQEIIMSEMLARVWAAVLDTVDRERSTSQYGAIGRGALVGHLLVRRRAEKLLDSRLEEYPNIAAPLKRLLQRVDRWGNMWLGYLAKDYPTAARIAKSPEETLEFAADLKLQCQDRGAHYVWQILLHSQQQALGKAAMPLAPNADLNQEIAVAIIACFPSELFEATGPFESLFLSRLENATDDSLRMIEDFLAVESGGLNEKDKDSRAIDRTDRRLERLGLD